MKKVTFILYAIFFCLTACVKNDGSVSDGRFCTSDLGIVSVEEALDKLDEFLADVRMKSSENSKGQLYSSISPYYSNNFMTKSGEFAPEAYLVNFKNEEGFAILGANNKVAPIIAVIEKGNTDWESIMSPAAKQDEELTDNQLERELLGSGIPYDILLSMCVRSALYGVDGEDTISTRANYTTEVLPLLASDYNYSQHRTYCHKNKNKFVTCGCCSVAISIVMAYLKTTRLVVDKNLLSYNHLNVMDGDGIGYTFPDGKKVYIRIADYFINSSSVPTTLSSTQMLELLTKIDSDVINSHGTPTVQNNVTFYRTRYKISSAIYYTLNNIIKNWNGTGTMPNALVNGLEDLGFTNVNKVKEKSLTSEQINTIANMLSANKPVLMGGWSLFSLSESHYWVVDGIKKNDNETLIHCNWGWGGSANGWFSTDCIRSDSPVTKGNSNNNEWNNILVFSYDKPSPALVPISRHFMMSTACHID